MSDKVTRAFCKECGSTDITIDATARWDIQEQKWMLNEIFDDTRGYCGQCEGDTIIEYKSLNSNHEQS